MSSVNTGLPPAALSGTRVLDFTHALAAPYCTMLLSDYGSEVYKLEARDGDMGRGWGPPFDGEMAQFFLGLNRGKHGISIDLKHGEGKDLCLRLIDKMDVLVENFRPAGSFTGILRESGMLAAMAKFTVSLAPSAFAPHLPFALGLVSMPLSFLFDPDSFYFGVLPVLAQAARGAGIAPVQMADRGGAGAAHYRISG